ncbi:MAG: hypothetical protein PHN71_05325 [Candidatus Cloacimonetes bacterium]|nr:hypothetical protein [Candidatus Cloacimonadota bacterium]
MKKGILVLFSLVLISSVFAFTTGDMMVGGQVGFSSEKFNSDAEATNSIEIMPQFGYFVMDNVCVDGILSFNNWSQDKDSGTDFGIGVGGRYFYNQIYGGLALEYTSSSEENNGVKSDHTGMYASLKAGYLYPLTSNVFVDMGFRYKMGLGDYGGDWKGSNEYSNFGIKAGLQVVLGN